MSLACLGMMAACLLAKLPETDPSFCRPLYRPECGVLGPAERYDPQPGDIFLATDRALWSRVGHRIAGGRGVHHSGIVFALPDGRMGLVEAGPFNGLTIDVLDPYRHMAAHVAAGTCVWVRRRRVPLTPDQSARLTAFILAQEGKPFATARMLAQATPFRTRGALRTWFIGKPHGGDRKRYFCSELVVESCVAAGLMDGDTARPSATLPRDLYFGRSRNPYLDRHLVMDPFWLPPARWIPSPLGPSGATIAPPEGLPCWPGR
jgi:hypothetical protein